MESRSSPPLAWSSEVCGSTMPRASARSPSRDTPTFRCCLLMDGRSVFVSRAAPDQVTSPSELWMVELGSGQKHRLFPGQLVTGYDVSRDDRVVAAVVERDGRTGVWVAWLDGREPPRRIPHADGDNPRFGRDGEILFRVAEKDTGVVYRILENGEGRERIAQINGNGVRYGIAGRRVVEQPLRSE